MAIVKKTNNKTTTNATTTPVTKKAVAPVKKVVKTTTEEVEVKKAVKATKAPAKETKPAATEVKGGKKMTLTGNTKTPKSFDIKEGSQATQDAFIDKFYKKLLANGWDITKEQAKIIKKAYSETLKEVTDIASYQDVDAGMYYARRYIKARVTEPPKAKDGLKTLMNGHYELKMRKLIGNVDDFKFFGDVNEDGTIFTTTDGTEITIDDTEVEVKPVVKKKATVKKPAPVVVEEEDEEEVMEEEIVDEAEEEVEIDDEEIEEVEDEVEDDEYDDFLDDEDEE